MLSAALIQSGRMSSGAEQPKLRVEELAERLRGDMIPITGKFSYFAMLPSQEEDLKQYLNDPIAAISPAIAEALPHMGVILAPYIEKANGKEGDCVSFERPPESRHLAYSRHPMAGMTAVALGIKEIEVADYHYHF